MLVQIEDHDGKVVLAAERNGGCIHHPQPALQDLQIADGVEHGGIFHDDGIVGVDAIDLGGLQNRVRLDLHGAQRRRGVGRKIGIAGAAGEDHDPALFQMTNGSAPDERLRHLVHLDSAHDPGKGA